ncbi:MAG: cytochrome c biogenesis protein CcdA [bacterium]|nr:cytochrome c biogenesis protein CcdA [bacterium]
MTISFIISAFFAGLITFLAPCTFPLVPGYLGFISGVSLKELQDPAQRKHARRTIFLNGVLFVLGFSCVFIIFGALMGFAGAILAPFRLWLTRIGGLFVIAFGFFMLNVLNIPLLNREKKLKAPFLFKRGKPINSFILGATFAFGWTPCVGPILGTILLLASSSASVVQGTLLLAVFSFGLAIPFLVIAACIGSASTYILKSQRYLKWVSIVGGIFLIFIGILMLTGNSSFLVSYGYPLFRFFNYELLLNYL